MYKCDCISRCMPSSISQAISYDQFVYHIVVKMNILNIPFYYNYFRIIIIILIENN